MHCAGTGLGSYKQTAGHEKVFQEENIDVCFCVCVCILPVCALKQQNEEISACFSAFWPDSQFKRAVLGLRLGLKVKVRVGFRLLDRIVQCLFKTSCLAQII